MTRYDLFRRRIIPLAIVVVFALLAFETCNQQERTQATFVIEYGVYTKDVRLVEAEIWMNNERVSTFRRVALDGGNVGTTKFEASLPDVSGELRVDVDLADGSRKHVTRQLHVREGDTVMINLEPDLR